MKPGSFAVLLLALLAVGGAAGGALGYALHEPNPYAGPRREASVGSLLMDRFVGAETVEATYEHSRRRWAAGGAAGGALLGFVAALAIGSYTLRYRATARPTS